MTSDDTRRKDRLQSKLDTLLPSPHRDEHDRDHLSVGDQMDNVLPAPQYAADHEDDASTAEELEVDTSNDGEDDVVRVRRREGNPTKQE